MSHDYAACRRALECPFGLGALRKIKILSTVSHRQSSSAFFWGGKWASKSPPAIGIRLYGAALKRDISFRGMF
ncbi:hypothetical protein TNCV_2284691 [Trichonephila clavipes]|nr:hypothetical protein TNCV_2284691 [Trichonephila clavipes]